MTEIPWERITIYEVDPPCQFPQLAFGYAEGCRCLRCTNEMRRARHRPEREPRYIPQEEWTTP